MLELIMNGFFAFIAKFCVIPFPFDLTVFDWIPFEKRVELMFLLDKWQAAIARGENIAKYGARHIGSPIPDEQERKALFEAKLKEAYDEAFERRELGKTVGVLTPPELDLAYCKYYCEWEMYRARKLAGEPVFFKSGHCCYDLELLFGYRLVPGAYPGLQNYIVSYTDYDVAAALIRDLNAGINFSRGYGGDLVMIEDDGGCFFGSDRRTKLFHEDNVIGPYTYAEKMRAEGVFPVPGLTFANHELLARSNGVDISNATVWTAREALLRYPRDF